MRFVPSRIFTLVALVADIGAQKILLTNDDGWATAQIRAEYDALRAAGYEVVLSAPAINRSGTGSSTADPVPLEQPCEFDTCPTGSPALGTDPNDPNIHYVNAFPADAAEFGIQLFSPLAFRSAPDLVISGSNIGNNIVILEGSGTIGAACEATQEGIPAIAFSGSTGSQVSYTTLTTNPDSEDSIAARIYSSLILKFLSTYLSNSRRGLLIPAGVSINVNFGATTNCTNGADDFKFVATRLLATDARVDTKLCGSKNLPPELAVVEAGCFVSVSVFNATTKLDVDAATQKEVFRKLKSILSCFS